MVHKGSTVNTMDVLIAAQVIHPDAINYTSGAKPGSAYLVYSDYRFNGPGGLSSNPVIVMILANNTQQGCSSMKLFAYSGIVMPYKQSALLSAQQASNAAHKAGYNVTFGQPLTLVPESNSTGIQVLVPGYSFQGSNYTIYSNAENGTISGTPNAQVGASQGAPGGLSSIGSSLSGVYNLFVGIWDWISQLLGGLTAAK